MADKKISALTSASLPLAGTEVLPIVQAGATVKVALNALAAGNVKSQSTTGVLQITGPTAGVTRVATVPDANWTAARTDAAQSFTGDQTLSTGNLIQGTAAKGFNFTANTPAAGMTSQLLNWYEEGTWTPGISFAAGTTGITYSSQDGFYTRTGNIVTCTGYVALSNKGSSSGAARITGLPFTINGGNGAYSPASLRLQNIAFLNQFQGYATTATSFISLEEVTALGVTSSLTDADFANNSAVMVSITYRVA
jgi:hypothetical protein